MTSLDAARTMPGVDEEGLLQTHFIKARFYTPLPTLHVRCFLTLHRLRPKISKLDAHAPDS